MNEDTPIYDNIEKPTPIYGSVTDSVKTQNTAPSKTPQPKVVAATVGAGVGAALSTIIVWIVEASAKIDVPESVELALPIIVGTALTFVAGYFKRG